MLPDVLYVYVKGRSETGEKRGADLPSLWLCRTTTENEGTEDGGVILRAGTIQKESDQGRAGVTSSSAFPQGFWRIPSGKKNTGSEKDMADFVQNSTVKSAVRELADPIPDVGTFN